MPASLFAILGQHLPVFRVIFHDHVHVGQRLVQDVLGFEDAAAFEEAEIVFQCPGGSIRFNRKQTEFACKHYL